MDEPGGSRGPRITLGGLAGRRAFVVSFPVAPPSDALAALSAGQREVASLVLAGRSTREIAASRSTSERTVANQLAAIYRKLGVSSRAELAARLRSEQR
jgi:DNA-binding CsgD family transcriptional regulator